ncbi:predicted protein [Sclerotinia sclerotiorum 1980 UF-70]|uniref:Uncharacterized protein n=1 Tax=Sclerotinia sclerotiorum (strain ATCC 18683 / 1980 / Ss-1) TaxID=665079 RepID=A7F4T6_SCLS1|nr:predicted protein [Sclerotinia sclerotiorum 1980 UF-70]EDN97757.1 predicted protein [Sclerotinia sclerotiorum 1980 UF-70]
MSHDVGDSNIIILPGYPRVLNDWSTNASFEQSHLFEIKITQGGFYN